MTTFKKKLLSKKKTSPLSNHTHTHTHTHTHNGRRGRRHFVDTPSHGDTYRLSIRRVLARRWEGRARGEFKAAKILRFSRVRIVCRLVFCFIESRAAVTSIMFPPLSFLRCMWLFVATALLALSPVATTVDTEASSRTDLTFLTDANYRVSFLVVWLWPCDTFGNTAG